MTVTAIGVSLADVTAPLSNYCTIAVPGESVGLGDVDSEAAEITNCVIGNLGGSGTYMDVDSMAPGENMQCSDEEAACVQKVSFLYASGWPIRRHGILRLVTLGCPGRWRDERRKLLSMFIQHDGDSMETMNEAHAHSVAL